MKKVTRLTRVNHAISRSKTKNTPKTQKQTKNSRLKTYHEIIEEAYKFCKNLEPFIPGLTRKPSTAFCILYKFFTMGLSVRQVKGLLNYEESPMVRGIGFLYLRYSLPAKQLWKWFERYFDDEEEFAPGSDKVKMYVLSLLSLLCPFLSRHSHSHDTNTFFCACVIP